LEKDYLTLNYQPWEFRGKNNPLKKPPSRSYVKQNQSTLGAEFVWVSECQKGEGCEIIEQFVCIVSPMMFSVL
jgi:hypothetical protein